jgi:hypothetical protein
VEGLQLLRRHSFAHLCCVRDVVNNEVGASGTEHTTVHARLPHSRTSRQCLQPTNMCDDLFASTGNAGSMWPCRHVDATMRGIVRPPHRKLTACSRPQSAQVRRHRPARREPHTPSGGGRHALRGVRCMSAVDSPNASSDPVEKRKNTSLYREVAAADLGTHPLTR